MTMIMSSPTTTANCDNVSPALRHCVATRALPNIPVEPVEGPDSTSTTTIMIAKNTNTSNPSFASVMVEPSPARPPPNPLLRRFALVIELLKEFRSNS